MKTYDYINWIVLTATLIINCSNAIPLSDFVSFGQRNGDVQFPKIYRAASYAIRVPPRFPYFNEIYNNIYVSCSISCYLFI